MEHASKVHSWSVLLEASVLAVSLHHSLLEWHVVASGETPQPASAVSGIITADSGGSGLSSNDEVAAAAAGGSGLSSNDEAAAAAEQLPQRFSKWRQHGLPEGVVKLLERLSSRWLVDDVRKGMMAEDKQVQQQFLRDVVELCEVLQQEVPCPVGCNNPHCVDFKGFSEITASCKTCTWCGVARYCSGECPQVGRWKEHKGACMPAVAEGGHSLEDA